MDRPGEDASESLRDRDGGTAGTIGRTERAVTGGSFENHPYAGIDLAALTRMAERAALVIERLRDRVFAPGAAKRLDLRFGIEGRPDGRAAGGRHPRGRGRGRLPRPSRCRPAAELHPRSGQPHARAVRHPALAGPEERGAGARRPELQGRRRQDLADLPPGAISRAPRLPGLRRSTATARPRRPRSSGCNPDADIDKETEPFTRSSGMAARPGSITRCARPWPGIALIPANLGLYDAEYEFAARLMQGSGRALDRLREGIETIRDRFDIILLDPPPALGMISLSVLRAADALLIPAPPNNIDFASTGHFLRMMVATLSELARSGPAPSYRFVRIVTTKLNETKGAHAAIKRMMDSVFPAEMLRAALLTRPRSTTPPPT